MFGHRRGRTWPGAAAWIAAVTLGATAPHAGAVEARVITVELNKLETQLKGCRVYLVVDNPSDVALQVVKVDLIFFRPDGIIDRRLAVDLGPVRPLKKSVRSFDLDTLPCEGIGSLLVNDVLDCRDAGGPVADCLNRLAVASRAGVPFSK